MDFATSILAFTLGSVGKQKLIETLQDLHDKNPISYEAAIKGFSVGIKALQPAVDKSKSPVDDIIISALHDAIETSAKNNNITL